MVADLFGYRVIVALVTCTALYPFLLSVGLIESVGEVNQEFVFLCCIVTARVCPR